MSQSEWPKLSLYHRNFCFFCNRVISVINSLEMQVDDRNIWQDEEALQELQLATGRSTVPVLRIEAADGAVTWLPESADIVRYLGALEAKKPAAVEAGSVVNRRAG